MNEFTPKEMQRIRDTEAQWQGFEDFADFESQYYAGTIEYVTDIAFLEAFITVDKHDGLRYLFKWGHNVLSR